MSTPFLRSWPGWSTVARQWKFVLAAYVLTSLVALPTAVLVGAVVNEYYGHRLAADTVAAGGSLPLLIELVVERPALMPSLAFVAGLAIVFWVVMQAFIAGAVLGTNRARGPATLRACLARGGQNLWSLLSLSLLGTPFVLAVAAASFLATNFIAEMLTDGATSTATEMSVRIPLAFVALVLVVWASSTHDLMRVRKVDGAGVLTAFVSGLLGGVRDPLRLMLRAMPWLVAAWVLTIGVTLFEAQQFWSTPVAIGVGVLIQQALVLVRSLLRVGALGAVQGLVEPEST